MNRILLYLLLFHVSLCAQNLVPNPGFEENVKGMVLSWQQPAGAYYHYSVSNSLNGYAHSGSWFNALCLLNRAGSEYLQIRLFQPLEAGRKYLLSFYACPGGNTGKTGPSQKVRTLDWHFPASPYDIKGRAHIKVKPEVKFPIHSLAIGKWELYQTTYTARGGEQLLLIGKFFEDEDSINKLFSEMNKRIVQLRSEYKKEVKKGSDSISAYYKSLPEYTSKKKSRKQQDAFRLLVQKQNRETNAYRKKMNAMLVEKEKEIGREYDLLDYYYDCRFHFDDISIVPVEGSILVPVTIGVPDVPVKGKKFTLENIHFETGKSVLKAESYKSLDALTDMLLKNGELHLLISGHTDNVGNTMANLKLSSDRARAVRNYLVSKGINASRLTGIGYGSGQPVADNSSPEGRQKNRRVEFELK